MDSYGQTTALLTKGLLQRTSLLALQHLLLRRAVCRHRDRDKEHSTIIFEGPSDTPLLRLGWNKQDPRYIATLLADSPKVMPMPAYDSVVCSASCNAMATVVGFCVRCVCGWQAMLCNRPHVYICICMGKTAPSSIILHWPSYTGQPSPEHAMCFLYCPGQVIILDIRYPSVPITQLARHHACANALAWAPHSASHLCTAGDDAQVSHPPHSAWCSATARRARAILC